MKSVGVNLLMITLLFCVSVFGQTPEQVLAKKNPPNRLVNDYGQILSESQLNQLERKLRDYNDSTSVQIAIVTFRSLDGYPLEMLANEIGEKWGVGQKDLHNGIVIVLSKDDRKVTLRGGYGIQAKMPATIEKLIIDREMIPAFKRGDYYQGLDNAITAISEVLSGQYDAKPKEEATDWIFLVFFIGIIILFIIIAIGGKGGNGGNRGRRGFNWDDVILSSGGASTWGSGKGSSWSGGFGGSGGGFGGSGGGFGGFGGGSFGGGGASGSW